MLEGDPHSQRSDIWAFGVMVHVAHFTHFPVLLPNHEAVDAPPATNEQLRQLIRLCLHRSSAGRPTASEALFHPYFTTSLLREISESENLLQSDQKLEAFYAHIHPLNPLTP